MKRNDVTFHDNWFDMITGFGKVSSDSKLMIVHNSKGNPQDN